MNVICDHADAHVMCGICPCGKEHEVERADFCGVQKCQWANNQETRCREIKLADAEKGGEQK